MTNNDMEEVKGETKPETSRSGQNPLCFQETVVDVNDPTQSVSEQKIILHDNSEAINKLIGDSPKVMMIKMMIFWCIGLIGVFLLILILKFFS